MFGTATLISRSFLIILVLMTIYFLGMDLLLYSRIQNYDIRPTLNGTQYNSIIPCDFNPLCTVTVKGLMLDHPNQFLLSPLAAIMDNLLCISSCWTWVTPNAISCFHVLIAILAAKCVSSDSLSYRRLGVIFFQARTWLDDLDGHIARKRANIKGERSDVGTTGYIIDGICDTLGCVALIIGLYQFLARNSSRRGGYDKLPHLPVSSVLEPGNVTLKTSNTAFRNILLITVHLFLTSATWNRYIYLYQDLLETEYRTPAIYLLEAGWCADGKMIGITEPRRVAATSLANRVADERSCILGTEVGYSIRFDNYTDETTKIKYMTEGILLRELMSDPLLTSYSVIVVDEVHERTLLTDIIMGLLKKIIRKRKSLRIVVCSATVDAEQLRDFFNTNVTKDSTKDTAVILTVEGRLYPVDIFFVNEPVANYVTSVVNTALKIHETKEPGDILAFLTGLDEVDQAVSLLSEHAKLVKEGKLKLLPLAMYGSLPNSEQLKVFWRAAKDTRKVIVATNIAETSITIPNIVYVIDCGFVKLPWYETETQTNSLIIVPVSKASANQRAGRAGRVRTGEAYRLYTEEAYSEFFEATPPEMQRSDLAPAILQLKALGIDNVLRFNFPSAPPSKNLLAGLELLYALGAIDSNGELTTPLGMTMAEMPLEAVLAKSLIVSGEMGCSVELSTILAMLQVQNVFIRPAGGQAAIKARVAHRKFEVEEGDLLTLLNVYNAYEKNKTPSWCQKLFLNNKALRRATEIRTQMQSMMKRLNISLVSCNGNVEQILKCITAGLFPKAAYLHYTGVYKTIRGNKDLHIHPNSCLYTLQQPQWLLFCEVLQTNKTYMKDITVIKPEWLLELAPHFYEKTFLDPI